VIRLPERAFVAGLAAPVSLDGIPPVCSNIFTPSTSALKRQQAEEMRRNEEERQRQAAEAERQRQTLLQQEADRKQNIQTGNQKIDEAFGGFDDNYYNKARETYQGAYTPEIDTQYGRSLDQLKSALAGRGVLESSVGGDAIAQLGQRAADARAKAANDALDFSNGIRSRVADSRNQLYAQSASAADPNAIASAATGQASAIANQGSVPPTPALGDLFGSFLTPFVNAGQAAQNSAYGLANRTNITVAQPKTASSIVNVR
jgi:hypothetical protein